MSKINIKSELKNCTESTIHKINTTGDFIDNKIIYKDENTLVTIFINDNKIEIERDNSDYKLNMIFDSNKSYYTINLKENDLKFDLDIELKNLYIYMNKVEINYKSDCEYLFTLEYNLKEW